MQRRQKRYRVREKMRSFVKHRYFPASIIMMSMMITFPVLDLPISPMAAAQEPVYYVATNGSDTNGNGSLVQPWATITHALLNVPDSSTILVRPGTYTGEIQLRGVFNQGVTVRSEIPYQARLRHNDTVITGFYGKGITLEGFDIAHSGPGAGDMVIQIQDLIEPSGGTDYVSRITLRNNILHDSYNNDILKVNNGAGQVRIEGNMFYNQAGRDEHIDVNSATDVIIQDNIFFNDFAGSGRINHNDTAGYIVVKDSNATDDMNLGSERITIRRNVFLNWEGAHSNNFVIIGEDGKPYYEAANVLIENNLMLGNSSNVMRAPFGVKGGQEIIFRHNTIIGDLPALAFAMRLTRQSENPPNQGIYFYNNIWADPTGTMGATDPNDANDFSDTPPADTVPSAWVLENNLYWNAGQSIPEDMAELINYTADAHGVIGDPRLGNQAGLIIPRWNPNTGQFNDGSTTIRQVFERLVQLYGAPTAGSAAFDAANPNFAAYEDILGNPRHFGMSPDIGAFERVPLLRLDARPADRTIQLSWEIVDPLPDSAEWQIEYTGPGGDQPSPIRNISNPTRSYTLTGLENYRQYNIVVKAVAGSTVLYSSNQVSVAPTDRFIYLPIIHGIW